MELGLKPIKKLVTISFLLHVISLLVATIVFISQIPLIRFLYPYGHGSWGESFVFLPPALIALIVVIFISHCGLTIGFLKGIVCESNHLKRLRAFNIISFIFVLIIIPIISWTNLENVLIMRFLTIDEWDALIPVRIIVSLALTIRNLAFSVLLIAASMSWYFCFCRKTEYNSITK